MRGRTTMSKSSSPQGPVHTSNPPRGRIIRPSLENALGAYCPRAIPLDQLVEDGHGHQCVQGHFRRTHRAAEYARIWHLLSWVCRQRREALRGRAAERPLRAAGSVQVHGQRQRRRHRTVEPPMRMRESGRMDEKPEDRGRLRSHNAIWNRGHGRRAPIRPVQLGPPPTAGSGERA